MKKRKIIMAMILIIIFTLSCLNTGIAGIDNILAVTEKKQIESEIKQTVENYIKAVSSKDIEGILSFFSDSEDFLHAGDGTIFGGYEKWANWMKNWVKESGEFLYYNHDDIHVIVLSKNAAACTYQFDMAFKEKGEIKKNKGCWTFVFRWTGSDWKVITSNGAHIGWSYED